MIKCWEHKLLIYPRNIGKEIKTSPSEINQKAFFSCHWCFAEGLWTTFQRKSEKWNNPLLICLHCLLVLLCFGNYPRPARGRLTTCASLREQSQWERSIEQHQRRDCRVSLVSPSLSLYNMSLRDFLHMVLIYEAVFKGSPRGIGIKVRGEDHTQSLTCLKVVWGAASAPVSSMYSSQLNSASSSIDSASRRKQKKKKITRQSSPVNKKKKKKEIVRRLNIRLIIDGFYRMRGGN